MVFRCWADSGSKLVFLRFPWKLSHLLPLLLCLVIVVALVIRPGARLLLALVAAQLLWGIVAVRLVLPNVADRATAAELDPAVVVGPLVSDVECRIDHPAPSDPIADRASDQAAFDAYNCAKRWAYGDSDEGVP